MSLKSLIEKMDTLTGASIVLNEGEDSNLSNSLKATVGDVEVHYEPAGSSGGILKVLKSGEEIADGDYDRGAGLYFVNVPGKKGQKSFDSCKEIAEFFANKNLDEDTKETPSGRIHKAKPGGYGRQFDTDIEGNEVATPLKQIVKRGRGRPRKDADPTGYVPKYEFATALQGWMVGNLPKGGLPGKPGVKHKLKDWMERVESAMLTEGYIAEGQMSEVYTILQDLAANGSIREAERLMTNPKGPVEEYAGNVLMDYLDMVAAENSSASESDLGAMLMRKVDDEFGDTLEEVAGVINLPPTRVGGSQTQTNTVSVDGKTPAPAQANQQGGSNSTTALKITDPALMGLENIIQTALDKGSIKQLGEGAVNKFKSIVDSYPHEHKMCQEGWGMHESLYQALCDHYWREGRIPHDKMYGDSQELRDWVEECYMEDSHQLNENPLVGAAVTGFASGAGAAMADRLLGDSMENTLDEMEYGMNEDKKWIQKAIKHPGALKKQLGVPADEKIPAGKLEKAAHAGGKLGQRARLAQTLKGLKKESISEEQGVAEGFRDDATSGLKRTVDFAKQHGYRIFRSPAGKVMKFVNKDIDHTLVARVDNDGDSINVNFEDWNSGIIGNDDASYFDQTFKDAYERALEDHKYSSQDEDKVYEQGVTGISEASYEPDKEADRKNAKWIKDMAARHKNNKPVVLGDPKEGLQRTVDFAKEHGYTIQRSPSGKVLKFRNKELDHTLVARVSNDPSGRINVDFEDYLYGTVGSDDASYFDQTFKDAYDKAWADYVNQLDDKVVAEGFEPNSNPLGIPSVDTWHNAQQLALDGKTENAIKLMHVAAKQALKDTGPGMAKYFLGTIAFLKNDLNTVKKYISDPDVIETGNDKVLIRLLTVGGSYKDAYLSEQGVAEGSEDYQEIFQMNTKQGKVGAVVQYKDKSFGFIYGTQLDPRKFDRAREAQQALNVHHNKQGVAEGSEDYDLDSNFMVKRWAEVALEKNPNFTIKDKDEILKIAYEYAKEHAPGFVDQIWKPKAVLKAYFYLQNRNKPQGELNPDVKLKVKQQMLKVYGPGKVTFTYHNYHNYVQHEDKFGDTNSNEFDPKTGKVKFDGGSVSSTYYGEGVAESVVNEKLTKSMSAGEIISDFVGSDDPKFKGKSKKERTKMALGAYYGMHPEKSKKKADEAKDPQMEAWARELDTLLNEGLTLTTSTGQPGGSDSVSVSATDEDAKTLMKLIQDAGLMKAQSGSMSLPAADNPAITIEPVSQDEVMGTLEPASDEVDSGDGALSFLKRMIGARGDHAGHIHGDYEQEGNSEEACEECGHSDCQCDHEEVGEMHNQAASSGDANMSALPEELHGGQKQLDLNKSGDLDAEDFKLLRAKGKEDDKVEEEALDQPATMEGDDWADAAGQDLAAAEEESANELSAAETEEDTAMSEGEETCNECGGAMYEGHKCTEELNEWANSPGGKSADEAFLADLTFMTKTLSGGLNNIKQDQTTVPSARVKSEERNVETSMAELMRKLQNIN